MQYDYYEFSNSEAGVVLSFKFLKEDPDILKKKEAFFNLLDQAMKTLRLEVVSIPEPKRK